MVQSTVNETLEIVKEKACEIEKNVAKIPSLSVFDEFMLKLCGGMCWEECSDGFPLLLLAEWQICLANLPRDGIVPASNQYVQVSLPLQIIKNVGHFQSTSAHEPF